MPTNESENVLRRLKLVQQIDDKRAKDDPFRLPAQLRADVNADVASLDETDLKTGSAKGDKLEASGVKRRALIELERQLKGGYRFLAGIDEGTITPEQRTKLFETYGWQGGEIGRFDDERVISMAQTALSVGEPQIPQSEWRYPAARLERIIVQMGIVTSNAPAATGGERQKAIELRDAALMTAGTTLSRVRFYYCSAGRDADKTPELAKIEFQPRRAPGTVEHTLELKPAATTGAKPELAPASR